MEGKYFEVVSVELTKALTFSAIWHSLSSRCHYDPVLNYCTESRGMHVYNITISVIAEKRRKKAEMTCSITLHRLFCDKIETYERFDDILSDLFGVLTTTAAEVISKETEDAPFKVWWPSRQLKLRARDRALITRSARWLMIYPVEIKNQIDENPRLPSRQPRPDGTPDHLVGPR